MTTGGAAEQRGKHRGRHPLKIRGATIECRGSLRARGFGGASPQPRAPPSVCERQRPDDFVQLAADTIPARQTGNPLADHDLITTAHDKRDGLCVRDLLITTTIRWSSAHNLSA